MILTDETKDLGSLLSGLPQRHQACLQWFLERSGQEIGWPEPLLLAEGRTFLATQAKGIYKPEWTRFALSVRQTLGGPYADREPVQRSDGTWVYEYFQENADPAARDREFTNLALMACMQERVPVAVMRQMKAKPGVRYRVLGLALVSSWDAGYFFLEGFSEGGLTHSIGPESELDVVARNVEMEDDLVPVVAGDARRKVLAEIVRRRGQARFRSQLLHAYRGRCCVTGCDLEGVLEAAHISPYNGAETNKVTNGLLLRADLHTLFDLGLLTITESMTVLLPSRLRTSTYGDIHGKSIALPEDPASRPNHALLAAHREFARISDK